MSTLKVTLGYTYFNKGCFGNRALVFESHCLVVTQAKHCIVFCVSLWPNPKATFLEIGVYDPCRLLAGQRRYWEKSGLTGIGTSDKLQLVVAWNLPVCGFSFFNGFQNLFLKRNSWSYFAWTKEPAECVLTSACYVHWTCFAFSPVLERRGLFVL